MKCDCGGELIQPRVGVYECKRCLSGKNPETWRLCDLIEHDDGIRGLFHCADIEAGSVRVELGWGHIHTEKNGKTIGTVYSTWNIGSCRKVYNP